MCVTKEQMNCGKTRNPPQKMQNQYPLSCQHVPSSFGTVKSILSNMQQIPAKLISPIHLLTLLRLS
jgi:hypothetical protein